MKYIIIPRAITYIQSQAYELMVNYFSSIFHTGNTIAMTRYATARPRSSQQATPIPRPPHHDFHVTPYHDWHAHNATNATKWTPRQATPRKVACRHHSSTPNHCGPYHTKPSHGTLQIAHQAMVQRRIASQAKLSHGTSQYDMIRYSTACHSTPYHTTLSYGTTTLWHITSGPATTRHANAPHGTA